MTIIYDEGVTRLEYAKAQLEYENAVGVHTYHYCDCGRKMCREIKCFLCWEEEIEKLEKEK